MNKRVQAMAAAFQFLSRFPVRAQLDYTPELFRQSTRFYSLVGAAIGLVVWCSAAAASYLLPPLPAAVLILTLWVTLTGGLHLDGWMDTADGLLSYRSREKMLEIMKDSRVGAMGVIACVLLLLLKLSLIYSLLTGGWPPLLILLPPIWSRWFMVHAMASWPMARGKEGLAGGNFNGMEKRHSLAAVPGAALLTGVAASFFPLLGVGDFTFLQAGLAWLLLPTTAWAFGTWAARRMTAKLGGLTGDTYGALNEGIETVLLLVLVMIQYRL
ncbi:adenosylcobinamide-GDP ribazoletransferase [Paenibacillus sp.]|jgi:adenosylcobinamide-GDP ribazoletransferase|uniref:adenosylcobinamide-GDP ribazoletransferase n=1 Tax=Paenibacillus sp. TaxID=58172 RepID=UPI002820D368|nr:adenosylcobinamide-GDP ribazoletransferase [Paenibacillus sp.]MDR0269799.1 adenosylcobinamide-GDP ribazoletransferase [Paenibacillus sp.]